MKDELEAFIQDDLQKRGKLDAEELLKEVKENYMDDQYCHLYLEKKTLQGLAYKPVLEMIEKELLIVEKLEF